MSDQTRAGSGELGPVARRLAASQRVLVIEDEEDIAAFLRAYFRASGYDLVHVDPDDVGGVMDALEEYRPDLVMLDLRLRGFRGEDAYRQIRRDDRWAFVPVIVVSAEQFATTDSGGLDAYVSKPFNTNELADLVRDRIENAAQLAASATADDHGVMTERYLRARLVDEVSAGREYETSSTFALVQLRSLEHIVATVGAAGTMSFVASLIGDAREELPDGAVVGTTGDGELAVILPDTPVTDGAPLLEELLDHLAGTHELAGGARFEVTLVAGVAGFPENAADADELYMAADGALADARSSDQVLSRAQ